MIIYHNPSHRLHAPVHEFFRGERVPCFEKPDRADYVEARLRQQGYALRAPDTDSQAVLARVHAPRYLRFLQDAWPQWLSLDARNAGVQPFPSVWPVRTLRDDVEPENFVARLGLYSMDNGSPLSEGTWAAAKAGADAAASAAAAVAAGARAAFCCTRPPGHHAGPDFMGGYCFLNNAAVAAQWLLDAGTARCVAVLDVDYHHGNGTQSIFYERSDVMCISIHGDPRTEYPFYLGHADETGAGPGAGFNFNIPLPAGTAFPDWLGALDRACTRVVECGAQALVVPLGLDTFEGDPISRFTLSSPDFIEVGARLAGLGLPTVFVLEGGYAAAELGVNAVNVLQGFERVAGDAGPEGQP
ncbi:histone deacetylase family protein [Paracidovorax avenae]|uniref:histone deacetylase family protein n=1 Tax=Paracidovorax avenae TaxID=80867 RepID=UPI000D222CD7|nr:histone deacetylase family protein [Paracidovorax avenae]AVS96149.1 acetylpolyamine amidohydrolase [Paracidovorax avenae]AVT09916.1 acetylpolyamine amidohydrolase [Paracidovorax avenae]